MTNLFRRYIVGLLDVPAADGLLMWWTTLCSIYCRWPLKYICSAKVLLYHIKFGLRLHNLFLSYWAFWFTYYLKRDTSWPETQYRMFHNPLCPVGVWDFYKRMLFEMSPEELTSFLAGKELQRLYRERQLRCRFPSQLVESS
jgi:hypothetical protein